MTEGERQRQQRIDKLAALQAAGKDPFAIERYDRTHGCGQAFSACDELDGQEVHVAGRVMSIRSSGKAGFADLHDESGKVQLYATIDDLGEEAYAAFRDLDIGDIVGVRGGMMRTRRGEPSVRVADATLLAKALRQPDAGKTKDGVGHGGIKDTELRFRHRAQDLIGNQAARDVLIRRCRTASAVRRFLDEQGYLEVETPVLQTVAGGAAARPFITHHNKLDHDFKLRISLELPLKRLIIGGIEKVYEIGRVFRNEGIDTEHNPEFTLMEVYKAYGNLDDMMELVEDLYTYVAGVVNNSTIVTAPDGSYTVDLAQRPWRRLPMLEGIEAHTPITRAQLTDYASAVTACEAIGFPCSHYKTLGMVIEKVFSHYVQPHLIEPTFVTDYPVETSPLAKRRSDDPELTRRFEVFIGGQELGNAFSELNDPIDQRGRFEDQVRQHDQGDEEAHPMDDEFLETMELGMPPTGGLGVGIDRMAMILTGAANIKEVIMFPTLRPLGKEQSSTE